MNTKAFSNLNEAITHLDSDFVKMQSIVLKKDLEAQILKKFETILNEMIYSSIELQGITFGDTKLVFTEIRDRTKKVSSQLRKLKKDKFATNEDLAKIGKGLYNHAVVTLKNLKNEIEYKDFVLTGDLDEIDLNAVRTIFKSFKSNREINVFEENAGMGERLLEFESVAKAPKIYTYGADSDVEAAQEAKDNGVFRVAKGGIHVMTPNCFDVFLFFQHKFTFAGTGTYLEDEVYEFSDYFKRRKPMKPGGYVVFNIPYYRIPNFFKRLMGIKIEGMYRTDDEAGNLIFVGTFKKPDEFLQRKELKKALMMPESIPHYSEAEEFIINKGDVTPPEEVNFKGTVVDVRDHDLAFKDEIDPLDFIESLFEPVEKTVELNEPLQEYGDGHLSAVAPTGITDGIYDTHIHKDMIDDEAMYPHLLSTKILRRDVITMTEEVKMVKGSKEPRIIPVISIKKSSELVMTTRTPDGKVTYLLDKVKQERAERKEEEKAKARKAKKTKNTK